LPILGQVETVGPAAKWLFGSVPKFLHRPRHRNEIVAANRRTGDLRIDDLQIHVRSREFDRNRHHIVAFVPLGHLIVRPGIRIAVRGEKQIIVTPPERWRSVTAMDVFAVQGDFIGCTAIELLPPRPPELRKIAKDRCPCPYTVLSSVVSLERNTLSVQEEDPVASAPMFLTDQETVIDSLMEGCRR